MTLLVASYCVSCDPSLPVRLSVSERAEFGRDGLTHQQSMQMMRQQACQRNSLPLTHCCASSPCMRPGRHERQS
eukprot:5363333-Amphidinium_carterae.3